MKTLLGFYTTVGKQTQASLNKHVPFLLNGPKPPTWQTPGRLQYYRAENEVYLPGKCHKHLMGSTRTNMDVNLEYLFDRRDQVANPHA